MIYYEQAAVVTLSYPRIFGHNEFFDGYTLHRRRTKAKVFTLRVFLSTIAASPGHGGFVVQPKAVPLVTMEPEENLNHRGFEYAEDATDVVDRHRPTFVNVPNFFKHIYGHWLVDVLPEFLVSKELLPGLNIKLLHSGPIPDFGFALAAAFGIVETDFVDVSSIDSNAPQQVISMSPLRDNDYFYSSLMRQHFVPAVQSCATTAPSTTGELIYVSRRDWKAISPNSRALLNREDVEDVFRRAGYTILAPERLSVAEQIQRFANAKVLAGEAGSGLHNSVFMRPGRHVICVQSGRQTHVIQASLCSLFDQSCAYVVGQQENADWSSNYVVDLEDVQNAIDAAQT